MYSCHSSTTQCPINTDAEHVFPAGTHRPRWWTQTEHSYELTQQQWFHTAPLWDMSTSASCWHHRHTGLRAPVPLLWLARPFTHSCLYSHWHPGTRDPMTAWGVLSADSIMCAPAHPWAALHLWACGDRLVTGWWFPWWAMEELGQGIWAPPPAITLLCTTVGISRGAFQSRILTNYVWAAKHMEHYFLQSELHINILLFNQQ